MLYAIIIVVIAVMVLIVKRKKGSNGEDGATRVPLKPAEPVQLKQNLSVYLYDNGKMRGGKAEMAQGLQVFDDNGICILDVTDRLCRLLGSRSTGTAQGSFTISGLNGNKLFAFLVGTKTPCDLSISGSTISWRYADFALAANMPPNGVIIYGSY
nr:MAG TPA: hypothetical protein [Caudoviricetes sp.]